MQKADLQIYPLSRCRGTARALRARKPSFGRSQVGETVQPDLVREERLEHTDGGAQPRIIRNYCDAAEIVPVLHAEGAVVPQRPELKAGEIVVNHIKHLDRTLGD